MSGILIIPASFAILPVPADVETWDAEGQHTRW
jgi:hypothetical protein